MNFFIQARDRLRRFWIRYERVLMRVWHALVALINIAAIDRAFPVDGVLQSRLLAAILVILCAFVPVSGITLIAFFFLMFHIAAISVPSAVIAALFYVIGYFITAYYQSGSKYNLTLIPAGYEYGAPYVFPMVNGLTGSLNDVSSVVVGSVISFYLKLVRDNMGLLAENSSGVTPWRLVLNQMFQNSGFYFYLVAMLALFLVVYVLRTQNIRFSWVLAVSFGTLTEFAIMLGNILFTEGAGSVGSLAAANAMTAAVGFVMTYFLTGLNYSRVERVQFEDDDYYYYVTAVPKIRLTEEEKTVKKITHGQRGRKQN